ncbi:MAG: nucleoside deaminase [Cucumibacter sp.]
MGASAAELKFFEAAYAEAQKGLAEGGIPIGSVLVRDGQIIGRGHNQRVQKGDAILHGEMDCLHNVGRQKTYRDTVLFTTLSPCMMCTGTAIQFGIPRVIVGESRNFKGFQDLLSLSGSQVVDLDDARCIKMMGDFIAANPALWNEDIAE